MADRAVRYFDFEREIIVELLDPDIYAAHEAWQKAAKELDALSAEFEKIDVKQIDAKYEEVSGLKRTFIEIAQAKHAFYPLT